MRHIHKPNPELVRVSTLQTWMLLLCLSPCATPAGADCLRGHQDNCDQFFESVNLEVRRRLCNCLDLKVEPSRVTLYSTGETIGQLSGTLGCSDDVPEKAEDVEASVLGQSQVGEAANVSADSTSYPTHHDGHTKWRTEFPTPATAVVLLDFHWTNEAIVAAARHGMSIDCVIMARNSPQPSKGNLRSARDPHNIRRSLKKPAHSIDQRHAMTPAVATLLRCIEKAAEQVPSLRHADLVDFAVQPNCFSSLPAVGDRLVATLQSIVGERREYYDFLQTSRQLDGASASHLFRPFQSERYDLYNELMSSVPVSHHSPELFLYCVLAEIDALPKQNLQRMPSTPVKADEDDGCRMVAKDLGETPALKPLASYIDAALDIALDGGAPSVPPVDNVIVSSSQAPLQQLSSQSCSWFSGLCPPCRCLLSNGEALADAIAAITSSVTLPMMPEAPSPWELAHVSRLRVVAPRAISFFSPLSPAAAEHRLQLLAFEQLLQREQPERRWTLGGACVRERLTGKIAAAAVTAAVADAAGAAFVAVKTLKRANAKLVCVHYR
eukprot:GHVT01089848.1.p1 GENE.GHVT01089848.1~~GHVT01089848.1.p1  ORF type:complete len:552 (-),score=91.27 GHVT01089848.1:1504-3159(-)